MQRKAPIRTCIACGAKSDKRALVRVVRTPDGEVLLDKSGKKAGRGAYICEESSCFEAAKKKKLFDARLRTKMDADAYAKLEMDFHAICAQGADVSSGDGE